MTNDTGGASKPTSWLHWVLLYPALATSLLGSLPTAWQAFTAWRLDVSYSRVQIAEEQQRLWERNVDCLAAKPVYSVDLPEGVTVGVTLCPSGDALLRYESQWGTVSYTWIRFPKGVEQRPQASWQWPQCDAPGVACAAATGSRPWSPLSFVLGPLQRTNDQGPRTTGAAGGQEGARPWPLVRSRLIFGATRCAVLRQGLAVRIYSTDGSACILEHIDVHTGAVVSRVRVPCTTSCNDL